MVSFLFGVAIKFHSTPTPVATSAQYVRDNVENQVPILFRPDVSDLATASSQQENDNGASVVFDGTQFCQKIETDGTQLFFFLDEFFFFSRKLPGVIDSDLP